MQDRTSAIEWLERSSKAMTVFTLLALGLAFGVVVDVMDTSNFREDVPNEFATAMNAAGPLFIAAAMLQVARAILVGTYWRIVADD